MHVACPPAFGQLQHDVKLLLAAYLALRGWLYRVFNGNSLGLALCGSSTMHGRNRTRALGRNIYFVALACNYSTCDLAMGYSRRLPSVSTNTVRNARDDREGYSPSSPCLLRCSTAILLRE